MAGRAGAAATAAGGVEGGQAYEGERTGVQGASPGFAGSAQEVVQAVDVGRGLAHDIIGSLLLSIWVGTSYACVLEKLCLTRRRM